MMLAIFEALGEESQNFLGTLDPGDLIQVGIAGIMLWAVLVSRRSAAAAHDSVEATIAGIRAQLLYQLASEFWSEEFGKACSDFGEFARRDDFVEVYREGMVWQERSAAIEGPDAPLAGPPPLDIERRRIKGYYDTVKQLHQAGFFTRDEVKEQLTSEANTALLLGPVEELEAIRTPNYDPQDQTDSHLYHFFGQLYPELKRPALERARRLSG